MADGQQNGFDLNAARQAGYSDDEILQHLTSTRNFDVNSALKSGYSKSDVIGYLASTPAPNVPGQTPGASQITGISAAPKSTGMLNDMENWFRDAGNDVRYGTGATLPGRILQKMGAPGTTSGVSEGVSEFMGSPLLGTARAAQGAAEIPQSGKGWQGTKDVVGGTAQALTIPSVFMGGPAAETGAGVAAKAAGKVFGDAEEAGQLFNKVRDVIGGNRIQITDDISEAAGRAMELSERGAKGLPRVISRFVQRVTDPTKPDIAWNEFRDFMSNVSRLSQNEYGNMNDQMAAQVGRLAGAMRDAASATAEAGGVGDTFEQAMQLYARSKAWQKFGAGAWQFIKKAAPYAAGVGAGGRFAISRALDSMP
jgi:hypothetical protein